MALRVEIVTPIAVAFEGEADEVQAPGHLGEFGVRPQHELMVLLTRDGLVKLHQGNNTKVLTVGPGFAEVGPDRVTLLVDSCEDGDQRAQITTH